jgi:hypothetical protein
LTYFFKVILHLMCITWPSPEKIARPLILIAGALVGPLYIFFFFRFFSSDPITSCIIVKNYT